MVSRMNGNISFFFLVVAGIYTQYYDDGFGCKFIDGGMDDTKRFLKIR
jgi:hypothetical protein